VIALLKKDPIHLNICKPSRHKRIRQHTKISVEVNSKEEGNVTICAIITTDSRAGKWNVELPSEGFVASENTFKFTNGRVTGGMRSYCKIIK